MNLDFDLSSDETELRITAAGRLDDDALVEAYRRFWERSGRPPLRRMLSDLPAVEGPGLSTQTIRRLADETQQVLGGLRAQLRSTIVASDDLHFGLARMHAAYTETALPLLVTRDIAGGGSLDQEECAGRPRTRGCRPV